MTANFGTSDLSPSIFIEPPIKALMADIFSLINKSSVSADIKTKAHNSVFGIFLSSIALSLSTVHHRTLAW